MDETLYKVELVASYPQDTHHRAGLVISKGGPLFTGLSKDQLEAIKNDNQLKVSEATEEDQAAVEAASGESAEDVAEAGREATEGSDDQGDEAAADQDAGQAEATGSDAAGADPADVAGVTPTEPVSGEPGSEPAPEAEGEASAEDSADAAEGQESVENEVGEDSLPTVDDLVRDNSREELNKLAVEAGVENPQDMDNKPAVAQAIVEKRG